MQRLLRASRGARGLATAAATPLKATLFPGDGVGPEISAAVSKILTVAGVPIDWDVQVVKHDKPDPRTNSFITRENLDSVKVRAAGVWRAAGGWAQLSRLGGAAVAAARVCMRKGKGLLLRARLLRLHALPLSAAARAAPCTRAQKHNIGLKGPMTTPVGKGFRSLNLTLRKELDLYANVRPCLSIPGYPTPYANVDLVTIRENTEGEYSGLEHAVVPGVAESLKVRVRAHTFSAKSGYAPCAARAA
jgi:isocitrate/isopropylmalate dehydrogenase